MRWLWDRVAGRVSSLPPLAILALGWCLLIIYAFPGQMTQDSFDHLREARSGLYSDGHPPLINPIWKLCDAIIAGPFGMLVLQTILLLAGLYFILRRVFAERRAAWWATAIFVFPPIAVTMAVIWKDCIMAGCLALGAAGLLSERRSRKLLALVAMFVATGVRYNAFGATLPLIVLLFQWRPEWRGVRRYALSVCVWFATTVSAFVANAAITDHKLHLWHSSLALFDTVGTLAHLDEDLSDDELRLAFAGTEVLTKSNIHANIREAYRPRDFFPIVNHPKLAMWFVPINGYVPAPEHQREAIAKMWWETITSHPLEYIQHRLAVLRSALVGGGVVPSREFQYPENAHQAGLSTGWSPIQLAMTKWMRFAVKRTPFFTPWIYLVIAFILLPLAARQRDVLAILLSGIVMESSLFFLAASNDYRYSHWMILCTIIAVVMLTARRYRLAVNTNARASGATLETG